MWPFRGELPYPMVQKYSLVKYFVAIVAFVSCAIYVSSVLHQTLASSRSTSLFSAPLSEYVDYLLRFLLESSGSFLLVSGLLNCHITSIWGKTALKSGSQLELTRSLIFRLLFTIRMIALMFLGLRITGAPLFFDVMEKRNIAIMAMTYLLDGIMFACLFEYMRKSRFFILPVFVLYIAVSRTVIDGVMHAEYLAYPSYCDDASPGSTPYIVCKTLGPDVPKLVKAPAAAYSNFFQASERISLPEKNSNGEPFDADTIIGICQHELGHKRHHHVTILSTINIMGDMLPLAMAHFLLLDPKLLTGLLGDKAESVPIVAYSTAEVLSSILRSILKPFFLLLSRHFEFEADSNVGAKYVDSVSVFLNNTFDDAKITPLYRALHFRHPSNDERIARMKAGAEACCNPQN